MKASLGYAALTESIQSQQNRREQLSVVLDVPAVERFSETAY